MTDLSAEFRNAGIVLCRLTNLVKTGEVLLSFHGDYFCFRWTYKFNGNSERLMSCKVIDDFRGQFDADKFANGIFGQWKEHVGKFDSVHDFV